MESNEIILNKEEFDLNEKEFAKEYWSNINYSSYTKEQPWSQFIAEKIVNINPKNVFEFGCNAGKNLLAIKNKNSNVNTFGVDINCDAIKFAQNEWSLNVLCMDEKIFSLIPDNTYDIVYTVSVLDHVPEPEKILKEMLRVSKKAVFLLEPWLGKEGKVVKNYNIRREKVIDTTPYSYSWNYKTLFQDYKNEWNLNIEEYKLDSNLGRFYYFYEITSKK